jgi:hypothetical protein
MNGQPQPLGQVAMSLAWSQQQRMTTTCGFCGESFEAQVPDAIAWFAEHRARKHPNVPEPQRRGNGRSKSSKPGD